MGYLSFPLLAQKPEKKVLFVILDGIPADVIDSVSTPYIDQISKIGGFTKAVMGGDIGTYSETPTISAVGYNSLLTGTWVNKHNVWGNSIENPNYNYWTIFRFLKEARPDKKTAIFSTWLDNRTKLVGASLPQTGNSSFEYYFDGFELDTVNLPHDKDRNYIFLIDELVSKEAANYIKEKGPDLSWMYLEFTDDMGHQFGNSPQMIDGIGKADIQIGRVWEAIKYRETHFNEDWLIIITTDHGRSADGFDHGNQSDRERTIWIATNGKGLNSHFYDTPEMVDIMPTIARYLDLEIPKKQAMELDGASFIGKIAAIDLKAELRDGGLELSWKSISEGQKGRVWVSTTNEFKAGNLDNYWLMGEVLLEQESFKFSTKGLESDYYKIVLETPSGYLNYWIVSN